MARDISKSFIGGALLILNAVLFCVAGSAWALDHDLHMTGVYTADSSGSLTQSLACNSPEKVCAIIHVNGDLDNRFNSGQATIKLSARVTGSDTWEDLGSVPVTWQQNERSLDRGYTWPLDWQSHPNNCVDITSEKPNYDLRAEVILPPDSPDQYPNDNSLTVSAITTCSVPPPGCLQLPNNKIICRESCPDQLKPLCDEGWNLCRINPKLCQPHDICKQFPEVCLPHQCSGHLCGPGLCPKCGSGPVEVLFDDNQNSLSMAAVNNKGEIVATMQKLKKPIREGSIRYNQHLTFVAQPDTTYKLIFVSTKNTPLNKEMPFNYRVKGTPKKGTK